MDLQMQRLDCVYCGFVFEVPKAFIERRQEDHASFYCPACRKGMYYEEETECEKAQERADRLERELEAARKKSRYLEHCRRATKGAVTKLRKKLAETRGET